MYTAESVPAWYSSAVVTCTEYATDIALCTSLESSAGGFSQKLHGNQHSILSSETTVTSSTCQPGCTGPACTVLES
jgi:hypothetical protein